MAKASFYIDSNLAVNGNVTANAGSFSTLSVSNNMLLGNASPLIANEVGTTFDTTDTAIDSFYGALYRSAKYVVSITNGSNYQISEVALTHDSANAYFTVYGEVSSTASPFVTFNANVSGGITSLWASGTSLGNVAKILKMYVAV